MKKERERGEMTEMAATVEARWPTIRVSAPCG